jgi:hypothetical protein
MIIINKFMGQSGDSFHISHGFFTKIKRVNEPFISAVFFLLRDII